MAEALTYDSLVSDIQLYAERTDSPFVEQIPRFIMLAENRLTSEAKGLGFMRIANFNFATPNFEKPARWRETISFMITTLSGIKFLYSRDYTYCRIYWPDTSLTDEPRFYADYDYANFFVVPAPDKAYPAELAYYERPEPLSVTNQTNWTTQYAPQLLLYAALLEAQPFLKLQERIPEFQAMYDRALQGLKAEEVSRMSDSASNRG